MLVKIRRSAQTSGRLTRFVCLSIFLACTSFRIEPTIHDLAEQTRIKLNSLHSVDPLIRKYEVFLSDEGFLRYRKTLLNGKQEYYSCNVSKLKSIDYSTIFWKSKGCFIKGQANRLILFKNFC